MKIYMTVEGCEWEVDLKGLENTIAVALANHIGFAVRFE
jgi:hypothetical protein